MSQEQPNPEVEPVDAAREAEMVAITIGAPEKLNNTVHLADYDPAWPLTFARLADDIYRALGETVCLLEHVGSTSVPGLAAKPIIDMVLAVPDSSEEGAYIPQLERLNYYLRIREPDWFEHRVLKLSEPKSSPRKKASNSYLILSCCGDGNLNEPFF
ncbi:MAG: GrpB family protein [Cyanobacteria bacterium P01_C01_bin.118]